MDWKKVLEDHHQGFYKVTIYSETWVTTAVVEIKYYIEVQPWGNGFLKPADIRRAVFINGKMALDEQD